jgi:alkylation response protein AidB-like acyl-CoA dehydrogenase
MDFALSEEAEAVFDMAREFGAAEIAPFARDWEREGTIPKALWPKLAALGFGGLYVSEENGGSGLTRLEATLVFEALSMACPSVAAFLSIHNMCAKMIELYGSGELQARFLARAMSMETVLAYALTEPGSGSDAAALKTKATRTNDGYALTGTKAFISGGGYSDAYVVMCRTGADGPKGISAMVVEDGTPGLSFGGLEDKMGWRSQPTRQVQFDDCVIPAGNLLGEEGRGFRYAMAGLDGGRLNIAACSLGAAQSGLSATLAYMAERKAFGQSIDQFQALQFRLADMEIELQAARVFLRQAAWKLDARAADATQHCAMAKKFVTEAGSRVVDQCLQLHGGYGYLADYGIEKLVRDLRVHQILEGTNEIMRLIVARHLLAEGR